MSRFAASAALLLALTACHNSKHSESETLARRPIYQGSTYLALGDSIAFGFTPLIQMNAENVKAGKFRGYAEILADSMKLKLVNTGCAGETTGSFIDAAEADNGCRTSSNSFAANFPFIKTPHEGSQLDFATQFLREHPETRLVTLSLGGNDLLMLQARCNKESNPLLCKVANLPKTALTIGENFVKIVKALRAADFKGEIVFVSQYATDYKDPIQQLALVSVRNQLYFIAKLTGSKLADAFETMKDLAKDADGSLCEAGLIVRKLDGVCDEHPSPLGYEAMATAIKNVLD